MKKLLILIFSIVLLLSSKCFSRENNLVLECSDQTRVGKIQLYFNLKDKQMTNGSDTFKITEEADTYMILKSWDKEYIIDRFTGEMTEYSIRNKQRVPNSRVPWLCKRIERMF